jgi:hypothetical protein
MAGSRGSLTSAAASPGGSGSGASAGVHVHGSATPGSTTPAPGHHAGDGMGAGIAALTLQQQGGALLHQQGAAVKLEPGSREWQQQMQLQAAAAAHANAAALLGATQLAAASPGAAAAAGAPQAAGLMPQLMFMPTAAAMQQQAAHAQAQQLEQQQVAALSSMLLLERQLSSAAGAGAPGGGAGSSSSRQQQAGAAQQLLAGGDGRPQVSHSTVEKQRRDRLNHLIEELGGIVPPSDPKYGSDANCVRRPKHVVLADTINLLKAMQTQLRIEEAEICTLKQQAAAVAAMAAQHQAGHAAVPEAADALMCPASSGGGGAAPARPASPLGSPTAAATRAAAAAAAGGGGGGEDASGMHCELPSAPVGGGNATGVVVEQGVGCLFVKINCRDRRGLLSDVVGALRSFPVVISTAAITTTADGKVHDVFEVRWLRAGGACEGAAQHGRAAVPRTSRCIPMPPCNPPPPPPPRLSDHSHTTPLIDCPGAHRGRERDSGGHPVRCAPGPVCGQGAQQARPQGLVRHHARMT